VVVEAAVTSPGSRIEKSKRQHATEVKTAAPLDLTLILTLPEP
jgi:hypothetical protein